MLEIANNEINAFNGLSGDDDGKVAKDPNTTGGTSGDGSSNWVDDTVNLLNAGSNAFVSINDSLNHQGNSSQQQVNYNIGTRGASGNKKSDFDIMDYLPWMLGGLGAILLIGMIIKK